MLIRIMNQVEEGIIGLLLVATTLLVFADVVLRFGFDTGLLWSQELTLYMSAWFVLFGASYGLKMGAHIGVDAFVRLLPTAGQRAVSLLAVVLSLAYCGLFGYGAWVYLAKLKKIGLLMEDMSVPMWIGRSILLLGLVLLSVRLLILLWRIATGRATGFNRKDEAEESMHLANKLAAEERKPQ
jgi:C4-dicarboxylate transporter DctQ subunit